jgi:hypothetical protein
LGDVLSGDADPELVGEPPIALGALGLPAVSLALDSLADDLFKALMVEPDALGSVAVEHLSFPEHDLRLLARLVVLAVCSEERAARRVRRDVHEHDLVTVDVVSLGADLHCVRQPLQKAGTQPSFVEEFRLIDGQLARRLALPVDTDNEEPAAHRHGANMLSEFYLIPLLTEVAARLEVESRYSVSSASSSRSFSWLTTGSTTTGSWGCVCAIRGGYDVDHPSAAESSGVSPRNLLCMRRCS